MCAIIGERVVLTKNRTGTSDKQYECGVIRSLLLKLMQVY